MKKGKISKESQNAKTAHDKGVNSTDLLSSFDEITLEFAQEIGLVPKVYLYENNGFFKKLISEENYRQQTDSIINRYCSNKEMRLCRFLKTDIIEAVKLQFDK